MNNNISFPWLLWHLSKYMLLMCKLTVMCLAYNRGTISERYLKLISSTLPNFTHSAMSSSSPNISMINSSQNVAYSNRTFLSISIMFVFCSLTMAINCIKFDFLYNLLYLDAYLHILSPLTTLSAPRGQSHLFFFSS